MRDRGAVKLRLYYQPKQFIAYYLVNYSLVIIDYLERFKPLHSRYFLVHCDSLLADLIDLHDVFISQQYTLYMSFLSNHVSKYISIS